jgi:hypothetical protein
LDILSNIAISIFPKNIYPLRNTLQLIEIKRCSAGKCGRASFYERLV